jgi:hypothetical protein
MHAQPPPQSIVPPWQSIVQATSSHFGAFELATHAVA